MKETRATPWIHGRRGGRTSALFASALLAGFVLTGCEGRRPTTRGAGPRGERPALEGSSVRPRVTTPGVRTPNADPNGADNQPDWDAMAATLRARLAPTLKVGDGADPREMCARLLQEANEFYATLDRGGEGTASAQSQLSQTMSRDVEGCVTQLSTYAIACVSASLREQRAEFPWLVDQCARAFPK